MPAPVLQFKRGNAGVGGTVPALRPGEPALSLNPNFDFFIGFDTSVSGNKFFGSHRYWGREDGTTSLRLKLVDKNGVNSINIKTPDTLSGIGTYTLPDTSTIVSGYYLKVGVGGTLSWDSAASTNNPTFSGITTISGNFFDVNANSDFSGITTFSNTTDNTLGNPDTGAVQIDGGLGINKNVTVGGGLSVTGQSYFIGTSTFYGGQLNLGDSDTDDINVAGEFISNLVPNQTNLYDLGTTSKRWRNGYYSGNLEVNGNLNVNGNVSVGGTSITLRGNDVFIENKDIILGYTTSITPNDNTANHAGVAIASTEGSPLISFVASGINTLPDTYKQLMWFKSGTLGFSTDMFAFNYGVAIGTTTVSNGTRLAVGSSVRITDTTVTATTGSFTNLSGTLTGTISTATRATTIDTVTAGNNSANYHLTFVDSHNGSAAAETVYTDDGIYYDPGANKFTTQHALFTGNVEVQGTLTGTATTATRATLVDTTGTSNSATYYVTFVDTSGGQTGETLRVGTALTLNASTGNVKSAGDLIAGSGYLASSNGTRSMYMYDTSGDVSFQGKIIENNYRSSTNASNTLTFNDLDATFARNLSVVGVTTVGTAVSTPTLRVATMQHSNGTQAATIDTLGNITASQNLTVSGDLFVNGSTTQVNTNTLTVEDRTIELGRIQSGQPTSTTWDLAVLFNYGDGVAKKAGLVWEASGATKRFQFTTDINPGADGGPTDTNLPAFAVSNLNFAPIEISELWINNSDCGGTAQQVISCSGVGGELVLNNITIDAGSF